MNRQNWPTAVAPSLYRNIVFNTDRKSESASFISVGIREFDSRGEIQQECLVVTARVRKGIIDRAGEEKRADLVYSKVKYAAIRAF